MFPFRVVFVFVLERCFIHIEAKGADLMVKDGTSRLSG